MAYNNMVVYIIQSVDYDINVDADEILSLMDDLDAEYCIYSLLGFYMR